MCYDKEPFLSAMPNILDWSNCWQILESMSQSASSMRDDFNSCPSTSVPIFSLSESSDRNVQGSMRNVDDDEIDGVCV